MKKQCFLWLCLLFLLQGIHTPVSAAPLQTDVPCSLTLHYTRENVAFPDLQIRIFRVAECFADGTYDLAGAFADYPVKIHGITVQKEWRDAAQTLAAYVVADHIAATETAVTDKLGRACFEQLQSGLYLVMDVDAKTQDGTFRFGETLIFLPTPQQDGTYCYDMEARPKPGTLTPMTEYTVVKLWKDGTNAQNRPDGVSVDILKDGVLQETVVLGPRNNWSHSWQTTDLEAVWTVVETNVPEGYTVTITSGENVFTITNTLPTKPEHPPSTGHVTLIWPYVLMMSISGCLLLALGIWQKRKEA